MNCWFNSNGGCIVQLLLALMIVLVNFDCYEAKSVKFHFVRVGSDRNPFEKLDRITVPVSNDDDISPIARMLAKLTKQNVQTQLDRCPPNPLVTLSERVFGSRAKQGNN